MVDIGFWPALPAQLPTLPTSNLQLQEQIQGFLQNLEKIGVNTGFSQAKMPYLRKMLDKSVELHLFYISNPIALGCVHNVCIAPVSGYFDWKC